MAATFGPHRFSSGAYDSGHTDEFRGALFTVRDLTGARFVDCDLSQVRIIDAAVVDVDVSGYVDGLRVNGVDVTAYVESELDRRHPERVQLRGIRDADGFRAMWGTLEGLWSDAVARAERLPDAARHQRVDEEWSFVETLRHLVFITDAWASRTVLDDPSPYHRIGLPQSWYPSDEAPGLGIDLDARPSYAEVLDARADRMGVLSGILDGLADGDLGRMCERSPAPGYPEEPRPVYECLAVVMEEECEHYRYAVRDLATLETH